MYIKYIFIYYFIDPIYTKNAGKLCILCRVCTLYIYLAIIHKEKKDMCTHRRNHAEKPPNRKK
jgi:hypothetical protein